MILCFLGMSGLGLAIGIRGLILTMKQKTSGSAICLAGICISGLALLTTFLALVLIASGPGKNGPGIGGPFGA